MRIIGVTKGHVCLEEVAGTQSSSRPVPASEVRALVGRLMAAVEKAELCWEPCPSDIALPCEKRADHTNPAYRDDVRLHEVAITDALGVTRTTTWATPEPEPGEGQTE